MILTYHSPTYHKDEISLLHLILEELTNIVPIPPWHNLKLYPLVLLMVAWYCRPEKKVVGIRTLKWSNLEEAMTS